MHFAEAICAHLQRLYAFRRGYMPFFAEAICILQRLYSVLQRLYAVKLRIITISVQLTMKLGLSLAIKISMFSREAGSKFIKCGLV